MRSLNRVFLMGHLGRAPELMESKAGKPYTRLSVATNRAWMNSEDQREEKTEWHSVFVWGPLAERCSRNLRKGALVFVEGSLSYWKASQEGEYKNAIHGYEVKFLNSNMRAAENTTEADSMGTLSVEDLDNPESTRNHNAVAHPA